VKNIEKRILRLLACANDPCLVLDSHLLGIYSANLDAINLEDFIVGLHCQRNRYKKSKSGRLMHCRW